MATLRLNGRGFPVGIETGITGPDTWSTQRLNGRGFPVGIETTTPVQARSPPVCV